MFCYCKSEKPFNKCCEPFISGEDNAKTAEQLMRSRYSGFVLASINYLMSTHHASSRPFNERKAILKWTKSVKWIGLEIVNKKAGLENDLEGWVEFKATYIENGKIECIHENSYFVKENGNWFYKSGEHK